MIKQFTKLNGRKLLSFFRPRWNWLHIIWQLPLLLVLFVVLMLWIWRTEPVTTSSFMLQQQYAHWRDPSVPAVQQEWVEAKRIPKSVMLAVIASEDQLFFTHNGIDIVSTEQAIRAALEGRASGGGSTITQQVAKNLFLWSGRSYFRKGLEWFISILIELIWTKQRILEVYLNIAQFSTEDYGVGAASESLFHKPVDQLTAADAALLAAVLPAPNHYSVVKPSRYIKKRQRQIQRQMRLLGGISFLERS